VYNLYIYIIYIYIYVVDDDMYIVYVAEKKTDKDVILYFLYPGAEQNV